MLLDSKSKPGSVAYQQDKLSKIPSMASGISKKIAKFRQDYNQLVSNAEKFFVDFPAQAERKQKLISNIEAYQQQIDVIENYVKEHGKLPKIKNEPSSEFYLKKLNRLQTQAKTEKAQLDKELNTNQIHRYEMLDHLVDQMLDLLNGHRIFSQFLGTIALSVPAPEEKVRHVRNDKNKPIYIAALTIALFESHRMAGYKHIPFLQAKLDRLFPTEEHQTLSLLAEAHEVSPDFVPTSHLKPMPLDLKAIYREEVLKPLAKAALVQSIGSHSQECKDILGEDKYRILANDEREKLVHAIRVKSVEFIQKGIGIPPKRFNTKQEQAEYVKEHTTLLKFMIKMQQSLQKPLDPLGDLVRIPMVYSSIILSTKPEFDYTQIYEAYDILAQGANQKQYREDYTNVFLSMVGRFPLGSGVYMIQQQTGEVERAIVSSLFPLKPDEPIVKQITRRQLQFLSHMELLVHPKSNMYFDNTRRECHVNREYMAMRFKGEFVWNAAELWEVQIPALTFWKKDGTRKYNDIYEPPDIL
ncbi:hypothetical protein ACMZOO_07355 [Catenovulum sp. SX2]|uniref:hypothetical protein n=1 Tax=Catenovulum sp. SX2 TaxID=3398614 RepID=UPI003F87C4C1